MLSKVKKILLKIVYAYNKWRGLHKQSVRIESVKSDIHSFGKDYPVREFRIFNKKQKCVALSKVMPGRFELYSNHYCVCYDVYVETLYRKRAYAERLLKQQLVFCRKEGFKYLIAVIRQENAASLALFSKLGFQIIDGEQAVEWARAEARLYRESDMNIALYQLK